MDCTCLFWESTVKTTRTNWTDKYLCQEALFWSFPQADAPRSLEPKASLRDIEASLLNPDLQAELGFDSLSSSQISRKIRGINPIILEEMFHFLVSLANQGKRNGKLPKAFIVDSTTVSLNKTRYPWAEFRTTKSGIKLHLRLAYIGKAMPIQIERSSRTLPFMMSTDWKS